jgi:hypothetical protein
MPKRQNLSIDLSTFVAHNFYLKDLRAMCIERGLPSGGSVKVLGDRLKKWQVDQNVNIDHRGKADTRLPKRRKANANTPQKVCSIFRVTTRKTIKVVMMMMTGFQTNGPFH